MRVLGLDLGARRIGLALSDPDGTIASPAGHLERRGGVRDVRALCEFIAEHEVGSIVIGLPLHMDGSEGAGAKSAREMAAELERKSGCPVALLDERWTTVEAERSMREAGRRSAHRRRKQKGAVDAVAAALILRTYLERGSGDR